MRSPISARLNRAVSIFCAAILCCGLIPTAAFAAPDSLSLIPEGGQGAASIVSDAEGGDSGVLALRSDDSSSVDGGGAASTSEDVNDSTIINQTMSLETVAQQESTRSYFLAQTLESTKTVPIVSANLPLDTSTNQGPQAGADGGTTVGSEDKVTDGDPSVSAEGESGSEPEEGDDSDESDLGASDDTATAPGVSIESTVVGSFIYRGITYAVEPGGESVAVVAADYAKLPEEFIEAQIIVLPSMVTSDGTDYYTVSRIADYAFAGITLESVGACFSLRDGEGEAEADARASAASSAQDSSDGVSEDAPIGITAVTIPASIVEIGDDVFTGCDTLQYLVVSEDNPNYSQFDGCLYDADQQTLLLIPEGRSGSVVIAPTTTNIKPDVFSHCAVDTIQVDANCPYLISEGDINSRICGSIKVIVFDLDEEKELTASLQPYVADYDELIASLGSGSVGGDQMLEMHAGIAAEAKDYISVYAAENNAWKPSEHDGWIDSNYLNYVTELWGSDNPIEVTKTDADGNMYSEMVTPDADISKQAVEDGEYYILEVDGQRARRTIASNGSAWWEITVSDKSATALGTLRIHCERGAVINKTMGHIKAQDATLAEDDWRWLPFYRRIQHVVMDHVDSVDCFAWFSGRDLGPYDYNIESLTLLGNTFPPSCTAAYNFFHHAYSLNTISPNFTLKYSKLATISAGYVGPKYFFGNAYSLASLPENFGFAAGATNFTYALGGCISLGALPDNLVNASVISQNTQDLASTASAPLTGFSFSASEAVSTASTLMAGKQRTYFANVESNSFNGDLTKVYATNTYTNNRQLVNQSSVTWDARGGTFSAEKTSLVTMGEGAKRYFDRANRYTYDCSRVYGINASIATITLPTENGENGGEIVIPRKMKMDGSGEDKFLGWYQRKIIDEDTLEYVWEYVCDGNPETQKEIANPYRTTTYYALYESDADKFKIESTVTLKMNDGTDDAFKTVEGQVYGQPMVESSVGKPVFGNYVFDGFWTDPVAGTQYYDAEGNALADALWHELETSVTLYAHWKYRIVLDSAAQDVNLQHLGAGVAGTIDGSTLVDSAYGNLYRFTDADRTHLVSAPEAAIEAIYGTPVLLPYATGRAGYADTVAWKANGTTVPVASTGWTVAAVPPEGEEAVKAAPVFGSAVPDENHAIRLTADWAGRADSFTVVLDAGDGALTADGAPWTNEELTDVVYDEPLSATARIPYKSGYTFAGFSSAESDGGKLWFDADGAPSGDPWNIAVESGENGARSVTLYARWTQDEYAVVYDLAKPNEGLTDKRPGAEEVKGGVPAMTAKWAYGESCSHDGGAFPTPEATPDVAFDTFFRNGYDFAGWYFIDDTATPPAPVRVADADGASLRSFTPSFAWQQAHKAEGAVTLYAEWTPKVYALRFDPNYQEREDGTTLPNASMASLTSPNTVKRDAMGTYYYEVAYEQDVTPFFTEHGTATIPDDAPFTFAGWTAPDGEGGTWTLFGADSATATSGAFTPDWPLSKKAAGAGGAVQTITFTGQWTAPEKVKIVLSAGDAARGAFNTANFSRIPSNSGFVREASGERVLTFEDVDYRISFDLVGETSPYRPSEEDGYALQGFLLTDESGRILDAQGRPTAASDPYDEEGNVRRELQSLLVTSLFKRTADTYAVAVYAKNEMTVRLDMAEVAYYEGYETRAFWGRDDAGAWYEMPNVTTYSFDVTTPAFALPQDVTIPGYDFEGWERKTTSGWEGTWSRDVVIDPAALARDPNRQVQVFRPHLVKRTYEVSFLGNHLNGEDDEPMKATIDFHGTLQDAGDFAGTAGFEAGATLPMAPVPAPSASSVDDRHKDEASDGTDHYHSYPFLGWSVGVPTGENGYEAAGSRPSAEEWSAWIARFAEAPAGTHGSVGLPVYAVWLPTMSAVVPLVATVAIDPGTGSVAMAERAHDIYGYGLVSSKLEVASLRYESVRADSDGTVVAGDSPLKVDAGEPVRLTLFANADGKPDLGDPSVDENGFIRGDYGVAAYDPLLIDLSARSGVMSQEVLTAHGFAPFSAGDDSLTMRYGLSLEGVHVDALRALSDELPDVSGSLREDGWTMDAVPVARLLYTVQLAR